VFQFQSASEHAIFIRKIEKKFWGGPAPTRLGAYSASTLAHSALNLCPLSKILNTPLSIVLLQLARCVM